MDQNEHIRLVQENTLCSLKLAHDALILHDNDIVQAIMVFN